MTPTVMSTMHSGSVLSQRSVSAHYKFTGKERDSESNLDNFGARYFTSNLGRFMTPDWAARPTTVPYATFGDPQSLNLYAYVRNDPVTRADLDGHLDCSGSNAQGIGCQSLAAYNTSHGIMAQNQSQKYDPTKTGPEDPTKAGSPLFKNSVVKKASDEAFMKTGDGTARGGLAEAGFAIEYKDGKISVANKVDSVNSDKPPNELTITTDKYTIAVLHTHGNNADPTPSPVDRKNSVPDFVRSFSTLYVTVPGADKYIQLQP